MNRLPPVFLQERRAGPGAICQLATLGLALLGHAGVALAFMPMWTVDPRVSTGNPPDAILAELVLSSSLAESLRQPQFSNDVAADNLPPADNAESADAKQTVEAMSPPQEVGQNPVGRDRATKTLIKPVQSTRPARNKRMPDQLSRLNAQADTQPAIQGDRSTPDPARPTFGHSAAVTNIPSRWKSRILAHLDRFKLYPPAAKSRREEGITLLCFTLDRNGRVLSFFVSSSSGSNELDNAAQEMIQRASPVPAIPDGISDQTMQLVVPVRFTVRP